MANIINHLDRADARATQWLDDKYPTAVYRIIVGASWFITACGVYLVCLAYWHTTAYNIFVGVFITLVGSVISTSLTLWAKSQIAHDRHTARREHPSYPYKLGR